MSGNITSSTLYNVNMASLSGGTAGGAEVAAYDAARKLALVLGANGVDFLNVMTGVRVGGIGKADVGGTGGTPTSLLGTANSVAIHGDKMAVAFDGASAGVNGYVAMFQMNGTGSAATWLYTVTGPSAATFAVPDMVTFTPDGSKLLVALEGEPASNYSVDPFGGVGVINVVAGTLQIADFTAFDSQKAALKAAGVRLNAPSDGATPVAGAGLVSKDVEPEYITISSDGTKAYVTLQEANSLAVVDLTGTPTVTAILPFGTKDHSLAGNGMDTSDQDGFSGANANIRTVPVKGLYMPDAIASFEQGGKTYLVTANEGDAREYSANTDVVRLNAKTAGAYTIQLDPTVFGANINTVASEASTIRAAADLGRLAVSRTNGDTDGDGDIDVIHSIGARSFSIWTIDGGALTRTYDSGDLIEQTLKANFPSVLDDGRSDDKGPEPEHVTLGRMNGDLYAFVGLERSTAGNSVVMSFRIDGPSAVTYTGPIITTGTGNQAPEAFTFVPGTVSAAGTGDPMLLIPNETAGAFRAVSLSETPAFTLQILSYYGESGLLGTKTAAKMGALIDKFDDEYTNTLVLAEGDSYIPGPWLIGGADPSLNAVPGIGTTALGRPDIAIMNAFGTDASALGNHEFDLGSPVFQAAITASGSGASAWVGAQFPFITANINTAADSSLRGISDKTLGGTGTNNFAGQETTAIKGKIAPYAISTQGGEKIGIIGITTFDLLIKSSPNGTVPKDDANPATTDIQEVAIYVQGAVDALKAMGVNKIVMVDQLDTIERNKELAPLVSGVDIMVAGGGHERLGDANDVAVGFNGHTADFLDTFPILVSGADGKPTLLVTTDTEYTYLGRLVVDFDAAGDIIVNNLNPVINGAYAATEASLQAAYGTTQTADQIIAGSTIGAKVDAITDAIQAVIAAKDGTIWGYTNVYLEGDRAFGRAQEVNFGNISADANMFKAQAALGSSAFVTSLKNGGGLRASVGSIDEDGSKIPPAANPEVGKPAGAISTLDIENALRFDNKLMVFDTTAAGLKAIMEYAAGLPAGNGGYMQIGGIRVSFDPTKAAGSKVMNIALTDASGHVIARVVENGAVVPDAPSVISMVSLNFTANGGDGYPIKANATNFRYLLTDGTLSAPINAALDFTAAANLPANALGEQKAFQEYLTAFHGTPDKAYSQADTPASQDIRIENLSARTSDVVFQGESIVGTTASETINGFAGNDTIKGGNGNDIINGGAGNDSLDGGADNDIINGGTGNDSLIGGEGNDTLNGGAGNDMLEGGGGNDVAVYAGSRDAATLVRSASGAWTVTTATGGTDTVSNVETLQFSDGKLDISGRFAVHPVSQLSAGDVDQDSAVLLAKLNAAGSVTFQVSTDPAFGTLLVNQVVAVADPLVPAKLQLTNGTLAAGTTYHWRALGADGEVETARFRTPDAVTVQNGFSMGVTGDWRGELAPYPAIKNAATAGLDLFVKLGDTIYADYASPAVNIPQAMTLADYRAKHNEVYSNQAGLDAWGNLQKTTAILVTIDDHEVINDFSGGAPASSDPRRFGTATGLINDTALYETGLTAFIEYNAIEDRTYANTGTAPRTDGEKQLYRYSLQGKDAAVFVLDARSFRDQELAPAASLTDPAAIGNFLVAAANPTRTMLGAPQLAQLKADLLDAQAKGVLWKFIQLPEPIQNFGVLGAEDRYEGYSAERNELLKFINTNNLTGVVFVSADIHGSVTNNLTYQDFPGGPQIATSAWEITTGSVAFDAPFGQTVGALAGAFGLLTPPQTAFYNSLPVAPDTDSALNDKDDFIKSLINQQVTALGYDPIGLNSNLAQANGLINATLVTGDYLVTHGYGWTKFDVDTAGKLTVTTYTVPYYSAAEAAANPAAIAALTPTVAAQFTVNPSLSLSGTAGADSLVGTFGNDTLQGQAGNDTLVAGAGNDMLDGGRGNDSMVGGAGNDTYIVDSLTDMVVEASGEGTDTVLTTVGTYTLGANLENLTYTGAGKLNGTGNAENNIISGGAGADTLSGGLGNDTLVGGGGNDRMDGGAGSDVVVFEGTRAAATITRTAPGNWTVTTATGGTDILTGVEEIRFSDSSLYTTSQTPYLVSTAANVSFASILSAGDVAGAKANGTPWRMVGVPDGLGAFDNGDGTMTVLMNQEIGNTAGVIRAHGSVGSFVSKIVIDKATLGVVSGSDLATTVYQDNDGDGVYTVGTTAWSRFCSGDLADVSAFYDVASGLGSTARIYLAGEETGAEGRAFAFVATGAEAGRAYELPTVGNMSFENVLARPNSGAKTVAVMTDDSTPGQVYFYIGDKQSTGTEVEKAGLTNGQLFGIKAAGIGNNTNSEAALAGVVPLSGSFTLEQIAGAKTKTGAQIETASDTAGVTEWWRPEDGAWDVVNPNRFYFVTTASVTGPSRLWALDFTDATNPALGGTFTALLDGTEGQKMFDNITVGTDGTLMLVEDVGGNDRLGKVWHYDPSTDTLTEAGQHDPARFTIGAPGFLTIDEEASGIIEVTSMLGDADTRAFLVDTQAHNLFGAAGSADRTEIVEGGQLQVMYVTTRQTGTGGNNTLTGSFLADTLSGLSGNDSLVGAGGNDSLDGGIGADTLDGGIGNDSLNGGNGADSMVGGLGNDTYWLDNAGDVTVELAGQGTDTVFTSLGAHSLGANVENVIYTGAGNFTGNGNALNNVITGAAKNDTLNGGEGMDTLFGLTGADRLNGGAGADVLDGGADNDVLDGGAGADMLTGGLGNDVFRFVRGEAQDDAVLDFTGNGSAAGDRLSFVGYGTTAAGASFTNIGGGNWQISSADGLTVEMISITGAVVAQDYIFS